MPEDRATLHEATIDFASILESAGIGYALVGGHAVEIFIPTRETWDADFVALPTGEENARNFRSLVDDSHFDIETESGTRPLRTGGTIFLEGSGPYKSHAIDLFIRKDAKELVDSAVKKEGIMVAPPERILIEELVFIKKGGKAERHVKDVIALLASGKVDVDHAESLAKENGVHGLLKSIREKISRRAEER